MLGIAASGIFAQKAFADFLKINYPLLNGGRDITTTHKVMKDYGVFRQDRLNAVRSYFIVDKEGILRYKDIRPTQDSLVPVEQLLEAVRKVNQGL